MRDGVSINPQDIGITRYKEMLMATVKDALEIMGYGTADEIESKIFGITRKQKKKEKGIQKNGSLLRPKDKKLLNHIEILAVLAARTNVDIASEAKSTQSELKNGKSLQTKRTRCNARQKQPTLQQNSPFLQ
jgi:hypothetical protein